MDFIILSFMINLSSPISAPGPGPQLFHVYVCCIILKLHLPAHSLSTVLSQSLNVQCHTIPQLHLLHIPLHTGVLVERVEVKDVRLLNLRVPERLQKAMAAEAEAARKARAKVIAAEGEHKVGTFKIMIDIF